MISNVAEPPLEVSDSLWSVERIREYIERRGIAEELDKDVRRAFDETVAAYIDSPSPAETLYHYTCESAMRSILLSSAESRHLRAGAMAQTNDKTEAVSALVSFLGKEFEDLIRDSLSCISIRLSCFSPDAEMPCQWRKYAEGCTGCAIGFNRARLQEWCQRQNPGLPMFAMNYDPIRHQGMLKFFIDKVRQVYKRMLPPEAFNSPPPISFLMPAAEHLFMLQLHFKDEKWQHEQEWRIRPMAHSSQNPGPFTELRICTPDLVTELILGSRFDGEHAAVERELREAGLGNVKVRRSSCRL